jgi:hypothetical protein
MFPMSLKRLLERAAWQVRLSRLRLTGGRRVALASFPRSGSTWFRFFLEAATGEHTGIAGRHTARILPRGSEGVVIKTHARDSHRYTHAIHLVRNPFDVLDSYFDWKQSLGWSWKHGEVGWDEFLRLVAPKWREHTRHWLNAPIPVYRVRYEDCRQNPAEEFSKLLSWLGYDISQEVISRALESTAFHTLKSNQAREAGVAEQFFRRGSVGQGIERFSPEQRLFLVRSCSPEVARCGYSAEPELLAPALDTQRPPS